MKHFRFLIMSGLVAISHLLHAQTNPIPNAGFESWSSGNPDAWTTTNIPGIVVPITQASASHSGTSAMQGAVSSFMTAQYPPLVQSFFSVTASYGTCTGWYTFAPVGGDIFIVTAVAWKAGTPIGAGTFESGASVPTYTQFSMPIDYSLPGPADSMWILLSIESAPDSSDVHTGSTFLIDDIALSGVTRAVTTGNIPEVYGLSQNYPNPFNPSTTIEFDIPVKSSVRLSILNILGQEIEEILAGVRSAGRESITWSTDLPSGLYFYRLEARPLDSKEGAFSETRRMILLK